MAVGKEMRRKDLIVPYVQPEPNANADSTSTLMNSLPMLAMFLKNKSLSWAAVVVAFQNWLQENPETRSPAATPALMSLFVATTSLLVIYMPVFLPPSSALRDQNATPPQATLT